MYKHCLIEANFSSHLSSARVFYGSARLGSARAFYSSARLAARASQQKMARLGPARGLAGSCRLAARKIPARVTPTTYKELVKKLRR